MIAALFAWGTWGQRIRTVLLSLVLLIVLALLGFWAYGRSAVYFYKPINMTTLSGKTQTQCVGRYLIDTPVEFGRFGSWGEFIYGLDKDFKKVEVSVEYDNFTQDQFVSATNKRINELQTKQNRALKIPLLLAQEVWDTPHGKALMLRYLENEYYKHSTVRSQLHMLIGSRYVVIVGESYEDDNDPRRDDADRISHKFINPKPMEERIKVIAQNIKGYSDANKAPEGFCLGGVVMNNKTMGYDIETASLGMPHMDKQFLPEARFAVDMRGQYGNPGEENLHQRVDSDNPGVRVALAANGAQLFVLRKGTRSINAMPALEYAQAIHQPNRGAGFLMRAETSLPTAQQSLARPFIELELRFGEHEPSPLSEDQALKLWDALVNSLRLSPANGGARIDDKTGGLVPETKVGQDCPKSGVWSASLPNTHPSARNLANYNGRFKTVQLGEPMPEMYSSLMFPHTADADNAAITWTWVREA